MTAVIGGEHDLGRVDFVSFAMAGAPIGEDRDERAMAPDESLAAIDLISLGPWKLFVQ